MTKSLPREMDFGNFKDVELYSSSRGNTKRVFGGCAYIGVKRLDEIPSSESRNATKQANR